MRLGGLRVILNEERPGGSGKVSGSVRGSGWNHGESGGLKSMVH